MKNRFSTLDLIAILPELNDKLKGMRVSQVYDVDHKTYLFKLSKTANTSSNEESSKSLLLIESGIRIHLTEYEWPKSNSPSGFTMKLRKHLNNKRIEHITQLGIDRIIDIQFGSNEASYHVIVELYDRGNILITDFNYTILNILRPRKAGTDEDVKLVVRQKYPIENAKTENEFEELNCERLKNIFERVKDGENLKKILNPHVFFGAHLIEHSLIEVGFGDNLKIKKGQIDFEKIEKAMKICKNIIKDVSGCQKGFIIQKVENRIGESNEKVITFLEFHPFLFNQHKNSKDEKNSVLELPSFDKAVDIFYSNIEGQKIDSKALQMEKEAIKKLENVKKDHQKRLDNLNKIQEEDKRKANLIEMNVDLVEKALLVIRSAIANQLSWKDIREMIDEAQLQDDQIAKLIIGLKLDRNIFSMKLTDPFQEDSEDSANFAIVDIDIDLSAYANARKYYDRKRIAAKKEKKTMESSAKAFKSAERKTFQALKEVAVKTSIIKVRKTFWFEKFLWFISSENYLVIAGRDAQQNEMIVKRYMKPSDVYVHADLHGATTVVVKNYNPTQLIPPKTLTEAGDMAICYSAAWDAKIITSAWWVHPNQVSKTAPTGEYLTVGSFMIRGKKNYLPLSHLVMGFGFMFKLDDDSIERHKDQRKKKSLIESENELNLNEMNEEQNNSDVEINISDSEDEDKTAFPDTKFKLQIDNSDRNSQEKLTIHHDDDQSDDEPIIVKSQQPRIKKQMIAKARQSANKKENAKISQQNDNKSKQLKRGQKSKLKKIKEKYKDQDEEERQLKMSILGHKEKTTQLIHDKQDEENSNEKSEKSVRNLSDQLKTLKMDQDKLNKPNSKNDLNDEDQRNEEQQKHDVDIDDDDNDDNDDDEQEEPNVNQSDEMKILDSLTGQPLVEDNLLFAVPVCAPYSSMQNYKYKVKVLPGMNRRGKAAKTALQLFIRDKTATDREKDLLKAIKDQDISKNLPNKIKIAASNLNVVKGKK